MLRPPQELLLPIGGLLTNHQVRSSLFQFVDTRPSNWNRKLTVGRNTTGRLSNVVVPLGPGN